MSSTLQAWKQLLKSRPDLVGGGIERIEDPEGSFRGPIASIEIKQNRLIVTTWWTAYHDPMRPDKPWTRVIEPGATELIYELCDCSTSRPHDMGKGRIFFQYPFSRITIFPRGGSSLDRRKVVGL